MFIFTAIWKYFADAINRTFIVDDRYLIFLEGIENTMIITVGALLLGVMIGVSVAVVKVYHHQVERGQPFSLGIGLLRFLDFLINIYLTVFRGTPVMVQLMIWAFVVLTWVKYSNLIAIVGFGVNSGAYVSEIVRAGIMAVDKGQTEAGRSLGLSAWSTMWYIVLPQAFKNVLPALSNELIALLKETSIAGYAAIQDVTKASSLVRARTFDPFFPLLCVAAFYLLCVMILTHFQKNLEKRLQASDRR